MKVGGNASFLDFLARHPGSYNPHSTDTKEKYLSRGAQLYKEELARRMAEDERQFGPGSVHVEGASTDAAKPVEKNDADFFDTWDAPAAAKKPLNSSSAPSATPPASIGFGGSRPSTPGVSPTPTPAVPAAPRTVTSSSLRTTSSSSVNTLNRPKTLGATRTGSSTSTTPTTGSLGGIGGGAARGKLGVGKLGVKKGGAINFEEAERKAREEEERIKRLGYDRKKEEEAAVANAAAQAEARAGSNAAAKQPAKKTDGEMERLGMGVRKLGFGQTAGVNGEQAAKDAASRAKAAQRAASGYREPGTYCLFFFSFFPSPRSVFLTLFSRFTEENDYARKTFGTQKGSFPFPLPPLARPRPPRLSLTHTDFSQVSPPTCTTKPVRTTPERVAKPSSACKASRALRPFRASASHRSLLLAFRLIFPFPPPPSFILPSTSRTDSPLPSPRTANTSAATTKTPTGTSKSRSSPPTGSADSSRPRGTP